MCSCERGLTQAVTSGLHQLVVLELTHSVVKRRHCCVKVTSSCEIASERIQGLLEAYFKIKKTVVSKNKNPLFV